MALERQASEDFKRALRTAFWRKLANWLSKGDNDLLPFYEVRKRIPIRGQRYLGLQLVPMDKIVGSSGRYRDFDRAFLPKQSRTKDRWINIDKARLTDVPLPPVELYKIGEAYFVKDGNHRVSVARQRGQLDIDAEVIEIDVPVPITADTRVRDLALKEEYADFLDITKLKEVVPEQEIELTIPGEYDCLLEHINVHRWYLGEQREDYVPFDEAVGSWFHKVYSPLVQAIRAEGLLESYPNRSEADLYLWVNEYQWYRRQAYKGEYSVEEAADIFMDSHAHWPVKKLVKYMRNAPWLDKYVLMQDRTTFLERTAIDKRIPDAQIEPTLPGRYEQILDHIEVHRWFLGEERGEEIPFEDALVSWYEYVYTPIVQIIRESEILTDFPGRSEADLYLWILENRAFLIEE
jgi:hypothetical protein